MHKTSCVVLLLCASLPGRVGAQELSPVDAWALRQRADEAFATQRFDEARGLYETLTTAQPDSSDLWQRVWTIDMAQERWNAAIVAGARLAALGHPLGGALAYGMARAYAQLDDGDEALDWLARALETRYEDRTGIVSDPAFATLRADPRFLRLTAAVPPELDRIRGWRFDLDFFVEEARRLHADPERPAFSDEFQATADNLRALIPQLSDQQVLMEFMRLAALLGDGHTAVYGPTPESSLDLDQRSVPVKFYDFSDGLYIVEAAEGFQDLVGSRVVRLGPLAPEDAFERLRAYRGTDNPMTIRRLDAQVYLRDLGPLQAIGASDDGRTLDVTIERPTGIVDTVALEGGDYAVRRKLRPPTDTDNAPLSAAGGDRLLATGAARPRRHLLPVQPGSGCQRRPFARDVPGRPAGGADAT